MTSIPLVTVVAHVIYNGPVLFFQQQYWQQGAGQQGAGNYGAASQSPYGSPVQPGAGVVPNVVSTATASSSTGAVVSTPDDLVSTQSDAYQTFTLE